MTTPAHTRTWFAATADHAPERPALTGDVSCDVCVIGGGYTGLSAALELAERGFSVRLLEAARVGWGASGRNGGHLITGYNAPMSDIERLVGTDDARALWSLNREATETLIRRVERHAIDCDLTRGFVHAARKPRHLRTAETHLNEMRDRYGYDEARLLDRDGIRAHVASDRYIGGLYDGRSGHLHPLNYALGLARAAAAAGVVIHEGTRASAIDPGPNPTVATPGGTVRAGLLVLGCNVHAGGPGAELDDWIIPVGTYVIATEPLGEERARRLMPTNVGVADMNFALNYFRLTPDHRMLFGGGVDGSGAAAASRRASMTAKMVAVFPELRGVAVDSCWGGLVAITMNRLPRLGRLSPTTYFAHGYSGHGVALAGLAGALIAEAAAGTASRFDVFARLPHRRVPVGKALRRPTLTLAMMWFRLLDLL